MKGIICTLTALAMEILTYIPARVGSSLADSRSMILTGTGAAAVQRWNVMKKLKNYTGASIGFTLLISVTTLSTPKTLHSTPVAAADHVDVADGIEPFSRDVFVVLGASLRNPDASTPLSAELYNVAGLDLQVTWGEWLAGTATSQVRTVHQPVLRSDVSLAFGGLVPNGVYSVFWATIGPDSVNPLCPGVERSLPLPSVDPAQTPDASSFVAGPDGTASFEGRLEGAVLNAQQMFFSIVYHADGQTYGSLPNAGEFQTQGENCRSSYGHDAMRQFLILQQWLPVAPPTAVDDGYNGVPRTTPFTPPGSVLDNDTGAALVARLGSPSQYGTVTLAENGTFIYTLTDPAAPVSADSFTYTACASPTSCSAPATVTLTLEPAGPVLTATVQQPIDPDGTSTFNANRGVIPVRFALAADGVPTCDLPSATIPVRRLGSSSNQTVDESVYVSPSDTGSMFRISDCRYVYNLAARSLGPGVYVVEVVINGHTAGSATFTLAG